MASSSTETTLPRAAHRRRIGFWRISAVLLIAAVAVSLYPPVFQSEIRSIAMFEAWRSGVDLEIGRVSGSIVEPISITGIKVKSSLHTGTSEALRIGKMEASFSLKNLVFKRGVGWLRKLAVDDLDCEMELASYISGHDGFGHPTETKPAGLQSWLPFPASIEVRRANLVVRQNGDLIRIAGMQFNTNDSEPGGLFVDEIELRQPGLTKRFLKVRGTVALREKQIVAGDVALERGMKIESASADISELLNGRVAMEFNIAAFGGSIRGELNSEDRQNGHLQFEATGSFAQISIASLADFLNSPEIAGGVIKEGKFSFYGSPRDPERATLWTRLEATDFRWGERQWNSLVVGATMMNRRLQVPEFRLQQAHNALDLKGEIAIPSSGSDWLQSEFSFDIKARIDNLTELSALLGPGFADMAGKLTIDGSVRGKDRLFDGQLIVSGSQLSYRTAPLDMLQAAIKLNGNEMQIVHFEFAHQDDYLRGQGTLNIFGERHYSGEIKGAIADLALYSAFMRPPVAPQAFAGALSINWSGDGSAKAHSGAFQARLKKVRPLIPSPANAFILDADLEATYSPQNIFFSKFLIGNGDTSFAATVTASPSSLNLQSIRVKHKSNVWLEGDALLPINVWGAWQHPTSTALWNSDGECKLRLAAKNLDLRETLSLTGLDFAVKGEITGNLASEGTLANPLANGQAKLAKGEIPIAPELTATEATVSLSGQNLDVEKLTGRAAGCDFSASGKVDLHNRLDPDLKLNVQSQSAVIALRHNLKVKADLDLNVEGPFSAARVTGAARVTSLELSAKVDLLSLILFEKHRDYEIGPPFMITQWPFSNWQLDVQCMSDQPLKLGGNPGIVRPDLSICGTGGAPFLIGNLTFEKMTFATAFASIAVDRAAFFFEQPNPTVPILDIHYSAKASGYDIDGYLFGRLDEKLLLPVSEPPLPVQTVFRLLVHGFAPKSPTGQLPDFLEGLPFTMNSEFLPEGKDRANSMFNLPPIEDHEFSLHSTL